LADGPAGSGVGRKRRRSGSNAAHGRTDRASSGKAHRAHRGHPEFGSLRRRANGEREGNPRRTKDKVRGPGSHQEGEHLTAGAEGDRYARFFSFSRISGCFSYAAYSSSLLICPSLLLRAGRPSSPSPSREGPSPCNSGGAGYCSGQGRSRGPPRPGRTQRPNSETLIFFTLFTTQSKRGPRC